MCLAYVFGYILYPINVLWYLLPNAVFMIVFSRLTSRVHVNLYLRGNRSPLWCLEYYFSRRHTTLQLQ